jgi:maltose alpha-D-glucosyltransferase/alpha-amylase
VDDQRLDPDSLMAWVVRLVSAYRETPELAWGDYEVLDAGSPAVLAHRCSTDGESVVVVHNLGDDTVDIGLDVSDRGLRDILTGEEHAVAGGKAEFTLPPYGFRWLRVV